MTKQQRQSFPTMLNQIGHVPHSVRRVPMRTIALPLLVRWAFAEPNMILRCMNPVRERLLRRETA